MKKLFIFVMIAVMAMSMASCNNNKNKENTDKQSLAKGDQSDAEIVEDTPDEPITLKVEDAEVEVGDVFTVSIIMENTDWTWDSFEFALTYDSDLAKVNSISSTELTKEMMDMSNPDYNKNGDQIKVAYASATSLVGGGAIIEIEFEAVASGEFVMEFSEEYVYRWVTIAATGEGTTRPVPLEVVAGTVKIK